MIFVPVEKRISVERNPLKISKLSETQTKKGFICGVEDTGDDPFTRENFILFKTRNEKTCAIKIDALRNCNVVIHMLNFLFQKEAMQIQDKAIISAPIPQVNVLAQAAQLRPQPTKRCCKEMQDRLAKIRCAAERIRHSDQ